MVDAAERSDRVTAVGYTYRRSPAVEQIRRELAAGTVGELVHFNGHYWCDYALDPTSPITWRYRGGPGTGALADVGSHLIDLVGVRLRADHRGERSRVRDPDHASARYRSASPTATRKAAVSDDVAPVENEDVATFTATFDNGAVGTFSASRVAHNLPDGLGFELFGSQGVGVVESAPGRRIRDLDRRRSQRRRLGRRRVLIGPEHPYIRGGLPMDAGGVGHGVADLFAYQTRAFLDQIAGIDELGPCPASTPACTGCASSQPSPSQPSRGGAAVKVV